MTISTLCADLPCEPPRLWAVVTDLTNIRWRTDLASLTVAEPGKCFVEHSKDGSVTACTITEFTPCTRYGYDMDNHNLSGHRTGIFDETPTGTHVTLTEVVTAKKAVMKPFVRMFLKTQQKKYLEDLKKALGI